MRKQYNLTLPFSLVSDATEIFCTFVVLYNEISPLAPEFPFKF